MNFPYKITLFFFLIFSTIKAQPIDISFDGPEWWKSFQKEYKAQLYNSSYDLNSKTPHLLWKNVGTGNGALLFDGYSTYMEIKEYTLPKQFVLSFWIAPRAFDNAIDNKISSIIDYSAKTDINSFRVGFLKHGQLAIQYSLGATKQYITNDELFLPKNSWSFVSIIQTDDTIKVFVNEKELLNAVLDKDIINHLFKSDNYLLTIGRNSNASGFGEKFKFNTINGLLDELSIKPIASQFDTSYIDYKSHSNKSLKEVLRLKHSKVSDNYRPNYHAIPPAHWMNEPHAPLFYNGTYHLFYQHNPFGPYWGQIHWGHWVSNDMVHWKHADIALAPEKGHLDPDGIWSGSAYIGPNNTPMLFYTAGNDSKKENQYASIAVPKDKNDKNLVQWKKTGLIVEKPSEYLHREFRDPFIFKIDKTYYMIVGSGIKDQGGTAALFESKDAKNWQYLHPFYKTDINKYPFMGGVWELPIFLPLPTKSGSPTNKYILMVLPLRDNADVEVFYWIGAFDKNSKTFIPDHDTPKLLDYGDFGFTGQSGLVDPKTNRSIVFSIAQGKHGSLDNYKMGWAHNAGLPIYLWIDNEEKLHFAPIAELESLRKKPIVLCNDCKISEINTTLKTVKGDQLEIALQFKPKHVKQGIVVRKSISGNPQAMVYYDPEIKSVVYNKVQSNPERKFKPLTAPVSESDILNLRIFLDKSMIEIYINDEVSITDRIYFSDPEAQHIELMGFDANSTLKKLHIWPMQSIEWDYVAPTKK
ncbi:GH32 C-terminal domain-containing protein [Jejuia pallidilutea]|uniref:beta-fructofuranosidase n=1 Tax=Jejuia pallidilutea TaxID=504487 RepID=A0A090VNU6_9FLAO|nr:GH32 C-terminal domain-containing protein [Jejuia pallidilutea]GAL65698.1 sucrose-6-phosphate hydrolase [Jejuia pallidilutea]GAL88633.1 sucrose-6-phosphate hydrolase [Jejuia pallidilutea]